MAVAADKITRSNKEPQETSRPLPLWLPPELYIGEFKAADVNTKKGIITSYLTVYNDPNTGKPFVDSYLDIVEPGSFTKTIKDLNQSRSVKQNPYLCATLWQHDRKELIGGIVGLTEDTKGVIYEARMNMNVQRAREAFALADAKMIGSSYGYDPIRFQHKGDIRHLLEIRLHEVSLVSFPANPHAGILDTKEASLESEEKKNFYVPANMPEFPAIPVENFSDDPENGTPAEIVKTFEKKATDFATAWTMREPSVLMQQFFKMTDILTMVLLQNFNDDDLDDKVGMVDQCCTQFADQVKEWYPEYAAADAASDAAEDDDDDDNGNGMPLSMIGLYSADMSSLNLKRTLDYVQSKAGRVLSDRNRKRLRTAIESMAGYLSDLQSLLSENDLQENLDDTETPKSSPSSEDIPQDITQGVEVLNTLTLPARTNEEPPEPSDSKTNAPMSFPELPDTGEMDITDLLASIQSSMNGGTLGKEIASNDS